MLSIKPSLLHIFVSSRIYVAFAPVVLAEGFRGPIDPFKPIGPEGPKDPDFTNPDREPPKPTPIDREHFPNAPLGGSGPDRFCDASGCHPKPPCTNPPYCTN